MASTPRAFGTPGGRSGEGFGHAAPYQFRFAPLLHLPLHAPHATANPTVEVPQDRWGLTVAIVLAPALEVARESLDALFQADPPRATGEFSYLGLEPHQGLRRDLASVRPLPAGEGEAQEFAFLRLPHCTLGLIHPQLESLSETVTHTGHHSQHGPFAFAVDVTI